MKTAKSNGAKAVVKTRKPAAKRAQAKSAASAAKVAEPKKPAAASNRAAVAVAKPARSTEPAKPAPAPVASTAVPAASKAADLANGAMKAAAQNGAKQPWSLPALPAFAPAALPFAGSAFGSAVAESTTATARGLFEINGKMLDLVRAQGEATVAMWRSAFGAGSVSEAIRAQTSGARQVYETGAAQWKDIAETATRVAADAAKPIRAAFTQAR